jgi:Cu/Ag efflux pump CusA
MSIAVIGGLITSTVLSLLVIPVVYTFMDDIERIIVKVKRKLRRDGHAAMDPGSSPG